MKERERERDACRALSFQCYHQSSEMNCTASVNLDIKKGIKMEINKGKKEMQH